MMDDEIFQGVSFAAVKEQLLLLGHDLPDHVILAYLDEGSAAVPPGPQSNPQQSGTDLEGMGPAAVSCSSAADSGRDPFEDLSAAEADALDRASSEPCGVRRSDECEDEDFLAALRLSSKAEDPCPYGALLDGDDPSWQSFHWSDAAATLHVSARAVLSPLAPKQRQSSWRRDRHGSAKCTDACEERGAAALQATVSGARTSGDMGSAARAASPSPGPSPPRHAGGATGVLSPSLETAADLLRPSGVDIAAYASGAGQAEQARTGYGTVGAPNCTAGDRQHSEEPAAPDAKGATSSTAAALRRGEPDQGQQAARSGHGACLWEAGARQGEEPGAAQHAARNIQDPRSWDAAALRGEESDLAAGADAEARSASYGAAAEGAEDCSLGLGYSPRRTSVLPRPWYYDAPRSGRHSRPAAPPPWRARSRHAVTVDYGRRADGEAARDGAHAASAAYADDDAAYEQVWSARYRMDRSHRTDRSYRTDRRGHSPERRARSAPRGSGSPQLHAPRPASAARPASRSGSGSAGASGAHNPARNRAVLAAAARKPPCVDRVARYQELKRVWDSDPFLRAGGGGAVPGVHRPPAGFREAFEAAHAAEAEERAYWARFHAAGGGAYGSNGDWYE